MKKNLQKLGVFIVLILSGCNFSEMNVDPNRITADVVPAEFRLPTFQYLYMSTLANNVVKRIGNVSGYVIYINGPVGLNNYVFTPADGSNQTLWENLYLAMNSGYQLIERAKTDNQPHYGGIAKVLMAAAVAQTSAIYGDVPYSQAFQAAKYQFPVFDTQESVYQAAQSLLDEAINDLGKTQSRVVAAEDLIFKGNLTKWIRTAYAIKARLYLHTVKINSNAYGLASAALANALQTNDDNSYITFESGQTGQVAPMYFERTGTLETEVDPEFGDLLVSLNDPRKDFFARIRRSLITGTKAQYGPFYAMPNSQFPLITYEECLFMQAEITMRTTGSAAVAPILKNAILASLNRVCTKSVGSTDPTENNLVAALPDSVLQQYATKQSDLASLTDQQVYKRIFQQKYVAMFLQAEAWNDYRRTELYVSGTPGLPEIKVRSGNELPRRLQYSAREVSQRLQNIPPNYTIFDRFWWDAKP